MSKFSERWFPPNGYEAYYLRESDDEFKKEHPVGYVFFVLLGITAFILPLTLFVIYLVLSHSEPGVLTALLGLFGSMSIGVCLFNFVAIIIKQYLGHLVSIISFVIGAFMVAVSLILLK